MAASSPVTAEIASLRGVAVDLRRHPIKGFTAEALEAVSLSAGKPFPADRLFAIEAGDCGFDPSAPAHVSKFKFAVLANTAAVAKVRTRYAEAGKRLHAVARGVTAFDGGVSDAAGRAAFVDWLRPVLGEDAPAKPLRMIPGAGWRFFDSPDGHLSIVNLESVRDLGRQVGAVLDPLRFRANIYVEGWPAWAELDLPAGTPVQAGSAILTALRPIRRCAAVDVDERAARPRTRPGPAHGLWPHVLRDLSAGGAVGCFETRRHGGDSGVSETTISEAAGAPTLVQAWTGARARLKAAQIDSPAIDARLLLECAAGATRTDILTDPYRKLTDAQAQTFEGYLARRERREPVSRIVGRKGFWKIMLTVTPDVLSPRPDTETVVQEALAAFDETTPFKVLDLGTGSGAILLAILAERPRANGLGTDVSDEALAVAKENAANLDLDGRAAFVRGDWAGGLDAESFDLVVSNPPYIREDEMPHLDPEVRDHDPHLALVGGADGLDNYRTLAPQILRILRPGGLFLLEIGHEQARAVEALMRDAGGEQVRTIPDLSLKDRVVSGRRPA